MGLLLLGAVVALTKPDLALHADRPAATPTPPSETAAPGPRDVVRWEPRGNLVPDEAFLAAAMARVTSERPEATRLFFAGRLPDGSRLVLAGTDVDRGMVATRVHALLVPEGTAVETAMVTEGSALTDPQQVLAWAARGRGDRVIAVAMTRPGPVRFEVSGRVAFGSDGSAQRLWTPVYAGDGVVVEDLGRHADPIVTVRAVGPGVFSLPLVTRVVEKVPAVDVLPVAGVGAAGYRGPDAVHLSRGLRAGAGAVADLDAARLEVLWSGELFRSRQLALVLVTRADGQRLQALVGQQGDFEFPAGVRALPRGASDWLPWLLEPSSPDNPTLLLCPTGPGTLVYSRDGRPDKVLPVSAGGVAALVEPGGLPPSASGAVVTLLDLDGGEILRTTLPEPGFDDPLALD